MFWKIRNVVKSLNKWIIMNGFRGNKKQLRYMMQKTGLNSRQLLVLYEENTAKFKRKMKLWIN